MMTRIGGFCVSMVRTCTGEVWVRSKSREPSGFGLKKNVSCIVARRMVFREIQLGEIVIVGLDVGTFGDGEAHVGEDRRQFVDHLGDRMHAADLGRRFAHRQRDVDALGVEPRLQRRVLERVAARGERGVDAILEAVDQRTLVLRSSGGSVPSVFRSAVTEPFLPSAATRTASSAASSPAAATVGEDFLFKLRSVGHRC